MSIGYVPEVPFEESVSGVGASLGDIPSELRALAVHAESADSNLSAISEDMLALSRDLDAANGSIANAIPLLDEYLRLVAEASDVVREARAGLSGLLGRARVVLTVTMLWMGLMQVAPLYLGWELMAGRRSR